MTGKIIRLGFDKKNLFGWEPEKSVRTIDYLIYRQEQGDVLPFVDVLKIDDETFLLDFNQKHRDGRGKGGHNRSISQCISNNFVECNLRGTLSRFMFEGMIKRYSLVNIKDIMINDDDVVPYGESFKSRREEDVNYRKEYPYDKRTSSLIYRIGR